MCSGGAAASTGGGKWKGDWMILGSRRLEGGLCERRGEPWSMSDGTKWAFGASFGRIVPEREDCCMLLRELVPSPMDESLGFRYARTHSLSTSSRWPGVVIGGSLIDALHGAR